MKKNFLTFFFLLFAVIMISCGKEEKKHVSVFTIKDDLNKEVTFDSIPQRIISLAPNITETMYELGADPLLTGVTTFCDYPPEAKQKTKIGGLVDPNFEIIASLKPDLVIMTVEGNLKTAYQTIEGLGIKVFVTNPRNVEGIVKMIKDIGSITRKEKEAAEITSKIENDKKQFLEKNKNQAPKDLLFLISVKPLISANSNSFTNEIIELAGLKNIYSDEPIDYPSVSYEDIVKKDPATILIPIDTTDTNLMEVYKKELQAGLKGTNAIKNNGIYFADANILFRPGPRITDAVKLLRNIMFTQ